MSFFDDIEEPAPAPRRPRTSATGRRPSGTRRRRPPSRQTIQLRRAVAAVALVVVALLIALGVHSCQVSETNNALKDYNNNAASILRRSDQTGSQLFNQLASGSATGNPSGLQYQINGTSQSAASQLADAKRLSVPNQMKAAQRNLVLALQMRADAIEGIASQIQPALYASASKGALNAIATDMARLYASDVVYKGYTAPLIAGQLNAASIAVGGVGGQTIYSGQFLPSLSWLTPSFIATELHVPFTTLRTGKPAPGTHGHAMDSVSVNGTALSTTSTNTLPASPSPTFTCTFTNVGQNAETNVVVTVSISGTSISGQTVVPQTTPGGQATARVTLSSSPPAGSYTVSATVERVPGEAVVTHNTLSFPVTFQ